MKTPLIFAAIVVIHVAVALYLLLPRGTGSRDSSPSEELEPSRAEETELEADPADPVDPPEPEYETYVVQRNDNLTFIARRFDTTVAELRSLNDLTDDRILIGQELRVPARPDSDTNNQ